MVTTISLWLGLLPGTALQDFIKKPEPAYRYEVKSTTKNLTELKLTSQTWQGKPWTHSLVVATPEAGYKGDTAILYITGDRVDRADLPYVKKWTGYAGMPVVTLFDIPNQPIFDAREDGLIALTFGKYLETGDESWPLLFPMTKSAIKAMDAIQKWSKGRIKRFVVTGGSKRGWTTWLVGATNDKRVIGIAPMVYDMLNMPKQLAHQKASWGHYSEMLGDYVDNGLIPMMATARGKEIVRMVDPYSYLTKMNLPTLVVVGTNDPYWALDAHRLYWNEIRGPKLMRVIPNVGHNLGDGDLAARSIGFWAQCLSGAIKGGVPNITGVDSRRKSDVAWFAGSNNLDFHGSKWSRANPVTAKKTASYVEYAFESGGKKASFTSVVTIRK